MLFKMPLLANVERSLTVTRAAGRVAEKVRLEICIPIHLFLSESTLHPIYCTLAIEFPPAAICLLKLSPF